MLKCEVRDSAEGSRWWVDGKVVGSAETVLLVVWAVWECGAELVLSTSVHRWDVV